MGIFVMYESRMCDRPSRRRRIRRWRVLTATIIASVLLLPSVSSAQAEPSIHESSIQPSEHHSLEIYIEGQEPHVIASGKSLQLSQKKVRSLTHDYLSNQARLRGRALRSTGWASCWRNTRHWFAGFPYDRVVSNITAECFGNFAWIKLTGSLRIERDNWGDRQVAVEIDYANENFAVAKASPIVDCQNSDPKDWRARNDLEIRYHSGTEDDFLRRESAWTRFYCDA